MKRRCWLVVFLLLVPAVLSARTWVVQQDGSGDFTDIQSAVDVASVGDSILIGPGRYDTFHYFEPSPNVTDWSVVVGVQTDSLTFIGMDRDAVIIGPTEPYPQPSDKQDQLWREEGVWPRADRSPHGAEQLEMIGEGEKRIYSKGIASGTQVTWLVVENMTFENSDVGAHLYPAGEVRDCTFRYLHDSGIVGDKAYNLIVDDCVFRSSRCGVEIFAYGTGQQSVHIIGCRGNSISTLVYNGGHSNVVVEDCTSGGGLLIVWGGHVRADRCSSSGGAHSVDVGLSGYAEINNCEFANTYGSTVFVSNATLVGSGNVLHGANEYATIFTFLGTVDLHNSHILHGNYPYTVEIRTHEGPSDAIDLRNNYWGTTSADTIAAWIWDGHDDPSVQTYVQYEPFSSVPIPTGKRSWGGVKALFR